MKSKLFFLIGVTILLLTACTDKTAKWRLKTEYHVNKLTESDSVYTGDGITYTNRYSDDGKRIGIDLSNGNRIEFVTTPSVDTTKTFNSKGELLQIDVWIKNEKGLPDSVINQDANGSSHKFIYDGAGNKIEVRDYQRGGVLHFVEHKKYLAGLNVSTEIAVIGSTDTIIMLNPVTMKPDTMIQSIIGDTSTYHYDFYPNKENSSEYVKYLKEHWGDGSMQLKKTSIQVSDKGDTVNIYNYRYTFDDQNRVTSIISESGNHTEYDSTSYTYY